MVNNLHLLSFSFVFFAICGVASTEGKVKPKSLSVEQIVLDKNLWTKKLADFEKERASNGFVFMSGARDALRAEGKEFTFFGQPAGEVVLRSQNGKISSVNLFLYNRGDNGEMSLNDFNRRFQFAVEKLNEHTGQKAKEVDGNKTVDLTRKLWMWDNTAILLESSASNKGGRPEFLRIRMKPKDARSGGIANRTSLRNNVVRDRASGDTFIKNIPMVDQGRKGYCAVASAARVYQYYGLETDQHVLAQIAGSGANVGTSLGEMVSSLKKVTRHVKSRVLVLYEYPKGLADKYPDQNSSYQDYDRAIKNYNLGIKEFARDIKKYNKIAKKKGKKTFSDDFDSGVVSMQQFSRECEPVIYREVMTAKSSYSRFVNKIEEYVDQGIPVGWCLQLGMFKEPDIPQAFGGHMRLIIGYNEKTKELIYTDSWGVGHEKKRMPIADAFCMSSALLALPPNK